MTNLPKWSTPERQAHLIKLFVDSGGFCIFGHKNCPFPEHHYQVYIESLISQWKADDRQQASLEWEAESTALHSLGERRFPILGRFNNISMDVWHDSQPLFYIEKLGMDAVRLQPFAKVKLSSSYVRLYVGLGGALRTTSKNRKRKIVRYGKPLSKQAEAKVFELVKQAVSDYLAG